MTKRLTAIIVLIAAVFSNVGCTKVVRVSAQQEMTRTKNTSANIVEVLLASGITGAILKNWDVVSFDSLGGKFDPESNVISGIDILGASVELNLNDIRDVQVRNDSRIWFGKNKGWLVTELQQIHGTTTSGKPVQIPLKDVLYFKIKKSDYLVTSLVIVGTVGVLVWLASIDTGWEANPFGDSGRF